jgi:hypothetical protein
MVPCLPLARLGARSVLDNLIAWYINENSMNALANILYYSQYTVFFCSSVHSCWLSLHFIAALFPPLHWYCVYIVRSERLNSCHGKANAPSKDSWDLLATLPRLSASPTPLVLDHADILPTEPNVRTLVLPAAKHRYSLLLKQKIRDGFPDRLQFLLTS